MYYSDPYTGLSPRLRTEYRLHVLSKQTWKAKTVATVRQRGTLTWHQWGRTVSPGRGQLRTAMSHLEKVWSATHKENTLGNSRAAVVGLRQQLIYKAAPRRQTSWEMINMHQGVCVKKKYKKGPIHPNKTILLELLPRIETKAKVFLLLDIQAAWLPVVLIFLNSCELLYFLISS